MGQSGETSFVDEPDRVQGAEIGVNPDFDCSSLCKADAVFV